MSIAFCIFTPEQPDVEFFTCSNSYKIHDVDVSVPYCLWKQIVTCMMFLCLWKLIVI
jgi:hypothetical protein